MSCICVVNNISTLTEFVLFSQDHDRLTLSKPEVSVHKQEFVPFLLNFLREQSSQALTHGPATPAKTPSRPRSAAPPHGFSEKRSCRSAGDGGGSRNTSRVQLFSPATSVSPGTEGDSAGQWESHCLSGVSAFSSPSFTTAWSPASRPCGSERRHGNRISLGDYMGSPSELQQSPNLQTHRGRRRSGGGLAAQGRYGGGRGGHYSDENGRWDGGSRRSGRGGGGGHGRLSEQVSPPSIGQLNLNNLEDFPPVGSSSVSPGWVNYSWLNTKSFCFVFFGIAKTLIFSSGHQNHPGG